MRYVAPKKELFIRNRKKFAKKIKPNTAAVFFANDLVSSNGDTEYKFTQNSNFYYLSGIDQEECILFLFPNAPRPDLREILFIKQTNALIQVWEGWKYSIEEAQVASGIQNIKYYEEFPAFWLSIVGLLEGVYLDFNEHSRNRLSTLTASHQFAEKLQQQFPAHPILRANSVLAELRMVKEAEEIEQLKRACDITQKAFLRTLQFIKPGVVEYEIEAEILHEFIRNGATGPAYNTILASGKNACILHYTQNNQTCKSGDLILMDFGAEYGNYSADLTRTVPVNGRFTQRQKAVYNAVLKVQRAAMAMLVPGNTFVDYYAAVGERMQKELHELGLISLQEIKSAPKDKPAYKKYFCHNVSHHLGLETHDVNHFYAKFLPGMVFTCEPGIYIPEEGIGIRLENDLVVTAKKPMDLMATIPIEIEEIEALMQPSKKK